MQFIKQITIAGFLAISSFAMAQQVTQRDTIGGTPLAITMDSRINDGLTDLEKNCVRTNSKTPRDTGSDYTPRSTKPTTPGKVYVPNRALTKAEICRENPRISGYKIQLVVVKSNEEANKVKDYFRNRYPSIKVQTDASLRPNYKILAGSYTSKQSAAADLASIRRTFKSAVAVPYSVFCVEAK